MKRSDIRYGKFWVRLVCCIWVGVAVANMVYFDLINAWDRVADVLLAEAVGTQLLFVTGASEIAIIFLVCIITSVRRIEHPISMVGFGAALVFAYILSVVATAVAFRTALPVVSPVLGLMGSSVVMETMAWSEERSRRRKLEQLEISKQLFTDMLVHDLRRRVASILMSFSLLEKKSGKQEPVMREIMHTIRVTAERVLIEISDLLDIRKIEEGKMALERESVSVRKVLKECFDEHAAARELLGVEIRLNEGEDIKIGVDVNIFSRVVSNLFWNAMQHAPSGSEIKVTHSRVEDGGLLLEVANHGRPIPESELELIFEAFVSGSRSSAENVLATGLGLAFCKLAVEAHGGSISLQSPWQGDDGVRVCIELPAN
jgi:signal transduction histidine kinase